MNWKDMMNEIRKFVKERNWEKFNTPTNLAIALNVEAGELLELFLWTANEIEGAPDLPKKEEVEEEVVDVLIYLLRLVDVYGIDLDEAFLRKMEKNAKKYPPSMKGKFKKAKRRIKDELEEFR